MAESRKLRQQSVDIMLCARSPGVEEVGVSDDRRIAGADGAAGDQPVDADCAGAGGMFIVGTSAFCQSPNAF